MGIADQRAQAARAAKDPEREEIRQLIDRVRRGELTGAARISAESKIEKWRAKRVAEKEAERLTNP